MRWCKSGGPRSHPGVISNLFAVTSIESIVNGAAKISYHIKPKNRKALADVGA